MSDHATIGATMPPSAACCATGRTASTARFSRRWSCASTSCSAWARLACGCG